LARRLPAGPLLADASFLLSVAAADPAAMRFVSVLARTTVTSVNFGEVLYTLARRAGADPELTEDTFRSLGVRIEAVEVDHVRQFALLKRVDLRSRAAQVTAGPVQVRSLSLGDMCCLGFALSNDLPVLTGDRHWATLRQHGLTAPIYDYRDGHLGP